MARVAVSNLSKTFRLYPGFRDRFLQFASFGRMGHVSDTRALCDVSFEVEAGEAFGIVGANGAGKSTLLRVLSGISAPSSGSVEVNGTVSTLLDVGAGFRGSFTGRENIRLGCAIMGLSPAETDSAMAEIVSFSELDRYVDLPLYTYSTGMKLRLGFSIAAGIRRDVFLVDEVIAVGDEYFQRKCVDHMWKMLNEGATIVLASHNLHAVKNMCRRAVWLEGGRVCRHGAAADVVDAYVEASRRGPGTRFADLPEQACRSGSDGTEADGRPRGVKVRVGAVEINGSCKSSPEIESHGPFRVDVHFTVDGEIVDPVLGVAIHRDDGVFVYGANTKWDGVLAGCYTGRHVYSLVVDCLPLLKGTYFVTVGIFDKDHLFHYAWLDRAFKFTVRANLCDDGMVRIAHRWEARCEE